MCGIVGFVGRGDNAILTSMTRALAHRGPDGEGLFHDPANAVFLGHRRLAILDLAGGAQPMWNAAATIGVVFNGEIYNHLELRAELVAKGYRFATDHSDTEVLVHGYEEWGDRLPERLNGMFAFAIYDLRRRQLFLARDRFGEKPLYYYNGPGLFAFGSELHALLPHPAFEARLDYKALQKFFAYGYLPAPNAIYAGVRKLPGGSGLTYDVTSGQSRLQRFWQFRIEPDESLSFRDDDRLAEELRHLLLQAVKRRMMSDVPLGIFLSGGIDSATTLACATQLGTTHKLQSFTIGFSEPSFDERPVARRVAELLGSDHAERILSLGTVKDQMTEVLAKLDEPLGDPSILPTALLARFTRERVTVALSGDGGDELFAGYDPFKALRSARFYAQIIGDGLHRKLRSLAELLPISDANMSWDFKIRRGLLGLSYPPAAWNPAWMAPIEPRLLGEFFSEPLSLEEVYAEAIDLWSTGSSRNPIDRTLEFFTNLYLPDDILTKADRATMMSSLESRAIFLDNDLVAFCQRLPHHFKYRNGTRKYLLKQALKPWLPSDIIDRPKKGFGIPLTKWLRAFPPEFPQRSVAGMNARAVNRAFDEHRAGKADHRLMLWCWLSLQAIIAGQQPATASV